MVGDVSSLWLKLGLFLLVVPFDLIFPDYNGPFFVIEKDAFDVLQYCLKLVLQLFEPFVNFLQLFEVKLRLTTLEVAGKLHRSAFSL